MYEKRGFYCSVRVFCMYVGILSYSKDFFLSMKSYSRIVDDVHLSRRSSSKIWLFSTKMCLMFQRNFLFKSSFFKFLEYIFAYRLVATYLHIHKNKSYVDVLFEVSKLYSPSDNIQLQSWSKRYILTNNLNK